MVGGGVGRDPGGGPSVMASASAAATATAAAVLMPVDSVTSIQLAWVVTPMVSAPWKEDLERRSGGGKESVQTRALPAKESPPR